MKNRIFYILSIILLGLAGCSKKFLDEMKSYDKYDESVFTNDVQTGWYIDRLYNYFFVTQRSPIQTIVGAHSDVRSRMTEEIGGTIDPLISPNRDLKLASEADAYFGVALGTGIVNNPYTRIRLANFLLEKIDGVGQVLPPVFRERARGQMYFMRALQYFELVRVYGGVPLVLTVQNASSTDESIRLPRAKTSECITQIVKDLDSAVKLLPMTWDAANYGRLSGAGALAMKSRVLLTAASPLFNSDWDNNGNANWQKALEAGLDAETKTVAAGYGNAINTSKEWAEVTFKNDNTFNGEALMVQLLSSNNVASANVNNPWENTIRPKDHNGGGGISAPKGMLDLFPLANGKRPTASNGYVDTFFFESREPRFYRTFAFTGAKWSIRGNTNKGTWLYRWKNASNAAVYFNNNQTNSPALVRKMSNPNADTTALPFSGTDVFEYRFGELLLNIAECYAAQGNTAKCIEYLGKIRKRVGIAAGSDNYGLGTFATKYAALEACLYERRVELAYEGKRFWDIQRWMLYDNVPESGNSVTKLGLTPINGTNRSGFYWQAKTGTVDPLTAADRTLSIDPDLTGAALKTETDKLRALYTAKFIMTPLDNPMDRENSSAVNILFKPRYYLSGITNTVLANNPWLAQTTGWLDASNAEGTFQYRN